MTALAASTPAGLGAPMTSIVSSAMARYGWDPHAPVHLLRHGENTVFRVDLRAGPVALRVHRAGYQSLAAIASELAWMDALRGAGVATPIALRDADGERVVEIDSQTQPQPVRCVAFEWIEAKQLASTDPVEVFPVLGRIMAGIHAQSREWDPPAWFERPAWDAAALVGAEPRWGRYEELIDWPAEDERDLATARSIVRRRLYEIGLGRDRFGLVHADLNPSNVLVREQQPFVIDFDDSGPSWFSYDAAVSLWEWQDHPSYLDLRDALADGYSGVAGGPPPCFDQLPVFLMARRLILLGWNATRAESAHARATRERRIASTPRATREFLRWAARS